jgi:hypothetical protein
MNPPMTPVQKFFVVLALIAAAGVIALAVLQLGQAWPS